MHSSVNSLDSVSASRMRCKALEKLYHAPPGISLWRHMHRIIHDSPPHVLLYGDSRLSNIQKWLREPSSRHGPRPLDNAALMETSHCSVMAVSPLTQLIMLNQWSTVNSIRPTTAACTRVYIIQPILNSSLVTFCILNLFFEVGL